MPRPRTGSIRKNRGGCWVATITLNDGTRFNCDPMARGTTRREARAYAAKMSRRAREENWTRIKQGPTPSEERKAKQLKANTAAAQRWVNAWLDARRARGLTSVRENEQHYIHHIAHVLGAVHVRDWTPAHLRELVAAVDAKVAAGVIKWKTAQNIWGTATRMLDDAHRSKVEALRCRDDNPSRDVLGPDRGDETAKQFLYPSEFAQFIACDEVPLQWRRMASIATYTYLRAGELRALEWSDVDLEHGVIHVHRAIDRTAPGKTKGTKGGRARRVAIEPALMPLLTAMKEEREGRGLVLPRMPSKRSMARGLRCWLRRAGVTRTELHSASPTTKPITFHDLRSTGLTWLAIRGDDALAIQQRAGHASFSTTQGYIRTAEALRHGFGAPFPPLVGLDLRKQSGIELRSPATQRSLSSDSRYLWRGGRDSNPRPPA